MHSRVVFNKYDRFIVALIASLAAGNLFGALQLPRILALLLLLPCLRCFSGVKGIVKVFALLFILFSFISSFWSPAGISEGIIYAIYNAVHTLLFIEIIAFSRKALNPIRALASGFLVAFVITAVIASWELVTDNHLSTSKQEEAGMSNTGTEVYVRYFAAATFYNMNTCVTAICFFLPFLFYGFSNNQYSFFTRSLFGLSTVGAIVIVLFNGSRGGLLAIGIMAMVYMYYSFFRMEQSFIWGALLIAVVVVVLIYFGPVILNTLIMRSAVQESLQEESRFVIWNNVMKVVNEYLWLGCGAGGLQYAMIKYASGGIIVAHNVFLEILSEYGFVFFVAFVLFVIKIYSRAKQVSDINRRLLLFQAIVSFPVIGIINSGYLESPVFWSYLSAIYVIANYECIKPASQVVFKTA